MLRARTHCTHYEGTHHIEVPKLYVIKQIILTIPKRANNSDIVMVMASISWLGRGLITYAALFQST